MTRFLYPPLLGLAAAALLTSLGLAQPPERPVRPGQPRQVIEFPPNPLVQALDANRDGTISAEELRNAAEALRKLDRNNDGQLTQDELRPVRRVEEKPRLRVPEGERRPGEGERRPGEGERRPGEGERRPGGERPRVPGIGPGAGPFGGRPEIGTVVPPFVRGQLRLNREQQEQLADLENDVRNRLGKILNEDQMRQLREMLGRGPGGPSRPGEAERPVPPGRRPGEAERPMPPGRRPGEEAREREERERRELREREERERREREERERREREERERKERPDRP